MPEAHSQNWHRNHNATHYPGTRQICVNCNQPTERCEEDSLSVNDEGPLCAFCFYEKLPEKKE